MGADFNWVKPERYRDLAVRIERIALKDGLSSESAHDVAFHFVDWAEDHEAVLRLIDDPASHSDEEARQLLCNYLVHVPNHLAAAAKLFVDSPVSDIFGVGAIQTEREMTDSGVVRTARFDPKVKTYWLTHRSLVMLASVFLIPLIPFYLIFGHLILKAYLARLSCVLTTRSLDIKRGILSRTESTVPLEKITDLQMFQGPLMRAMGIQGFRVETAGQSSGTTGYLLNMVGIEDTEGFRAAVLSQRDAIADGGGRSVAVTAPVSSDDSTLVEIRDSLHRIEKLLGERSV